jgi:hypothetical protein
VPIARVAPSSMARVAWTSIGCVESPPRVVLVRDARV